jgi:hypothetical protein
MHNLLFLLNFFEIVDGFRQLRVAWLRAVQIGVAVLVGRLDWWLVLHD